LIQIVASIASPASALAAAEPRSRSVSATLAPAGDGGARSESCSTGG